MADLVVKKVMWEGGTQVKPGTPLRLTAVVVNKEKTIYKDPVTVEFLIDAKPYKTASRVGHIYPGEGGVPIMLTVEDAWEAVQGDHMITARIAPELSQPRCGRAGHARSAHVRVAEEILVPPAPAAAKGFNTLTFSDDFDSLHTIDTEATGEEGYHWYVTRPWGEGDLHYEDDYSIQDSVMHLHNINTWWNYGLCTIDTRHPVGYAFNRGYIEYRVRMKYSADTGTVTKIRVPAVWSLPTTSIWGDTLKKKHHCSVELDWLEYWGDKYDMPDFFSVCLHEKDHDPEVPKEQWPKPVVSPGGGVIGMQLGDYEWHTLSMQWDTGKLVTYFDGRMVHKIEYSPDGYPYPRPYNARVGSFSHLDEQNMPIIIGGASDYPMEVDWIRVWSASEEPMLRQEVDE